MFDFLEDIIEVAVGVAIFEIGNNFVKSDTFKEMVAKVKPKQPATV